MKALLLYPEMPPTFWTMYQVMEMVGKKASYPPLGLLTIAALLPALIDWRRQGPPAPGFATQVTINLADDPELRQLMLEAGFRHIFIGIETPEEDSLIACQKGQNTRRDLLENVRQLQRAGFIVTAGFIVGFDTDTPATFQRQFNFIQESAIVIATINLLKAPPGTALHERLKGEGRLIEPFDFDESKTNIVPLMDPATLQQGYRSLVDQVYAPAQVYQRASVFLAANPGARVQTPVSRGVHWCDLATFVRLVLHLGVLGAERSYFWKLLLWTIANRPRRKVLALLFCVLMRQFDVLRAHSARAATEENAHRSDLRHYRTAQ